MIAIDAIFEELIFRIYYTSLLFFKFAAHCQSRKIAIFTHHIYFSTSFFKSISHLYLLIHKQHLDLLTSMKEALTFLLLSSPVH